MCPLTPLGLPTQERRHAGSSPGGRETNSARQVLNTADSIVLVRDREFKSPAVFGMVVSSYKEEMLVHADELLLVRDRIIEKQISSVPMITSYKDELVL